MKVNDFLLCTFQGDTLNPPTNYVAEITGVNTADSSIDCRLVNSGQQFTFTYSLNTSGPWDGKDNTGQNYIIDSHDIYTGGAIDPSPEQVAAVTFEDNKRYLCYVNSVDPEIDVIFYHPGTPQLSFRDNVITKSNWDIYPVGSSILSIEGYLLDSNGTQPGGTTPGSINQILQIASASAIAKYKWNDRGTAPAGYIKGMAVMFARVYCKLKSGDPAATEMAKANTGDNNRDGLAWFNQQFINAGMDNSTDSADTLRHLFVLLMGLGMRESSGKHCEGRDRGASNTTSDTAEAGLFQTSYNARNSSPLCRDLFIKYANSTDFADIFKEGVHCSTSDLENFGTGDGKEFQRLTKACPAFAVEFTAVALRNLRKHWGPINQRTAEIRTECDTMLKDVQDAVDNFNLCPFLM